MCVYTDVYMGMYKLYLHEHWNNYGRIVPIKLFVIYNKKKEAKGNGG